MKNRDKTPAHLVPVEALIFAVALPFVLIPAVIVGAYVGLQRSRV